MLIQGGELAVRTVRAAGANRLFGVHDRTWPFAEG